MATLVTGAGLVGTAFGREAVARGEHVVFLDPEPRADFLRHKLGDKGYSFARKDVRDLPAIVETIKANKVDTVVHSAGLIGSRVDDSLSAAFDINLGGTRNVAEAVRLTGVKRLIHISTFGVYDRRQPTHGPVTESFTRGGGRGYGNYKVAKELILEAYTRQYRFELIVLRPATVFGFGHFWSGSGGGSKMQELLEAGLSGRTAQIPASQTFANEYIYATDVGRAIDCAARAAMPKQTFFNIGNGKVSPFDEVLDAVKKLFPGLRYEIGAGEVKDSKSDPLDISAAKQHLGWEPRFTVADAFKDYLSELQRARGNQ